jgi:hypothetical protein
VTHVSRPSPSSSFQNQSLKAGYTSPKEAEGKRIVETLRRSRTKRDDELGIAREIEDKKKKKGKRKKRSEEGRRKNRGCD